MLAYLRNQYRAFVRKVILSLIIEDLVAETINDNFTEAELEAAIREVVETFPVPPETGV